MHNQFTYTRSCPPQSHHDDVEVCTDGQTRTLPECHPPCRLTQHSGAGGTPVYTPAPPSAKVHVGCGAAGTPMNLKLSAIVL